MKWLLLGVMVAAVVLLGNTGKHHDPPKPSTTRSAPTSKAPDQWKTMPGDGTHRLGGADGKNWGVWQATAPSHCEWSIRSVRAYFGAEVLAEGSAGPGETVRVNIQPDGGVSVFTGQIGDHRIVFMTHGCGAWTTP